MWKKLTSLCVVWVVVFGCLQTCFAELVGYWSFDEGSGTIAKDGSGNGNDGILENGTEWTTGKFGNAVLFDGTDDCVNLGNVASLSITDDFSFSMWVKISEYPTSWRNMLSKLVDDHHVEYNFRYKNTTQGQFYFGNGSGAVVCSWNPTEDLPLNTWTHIVGVRKSKTYLKLYFNGIEKRTYNTTAEAVSTDANVTIGRQSNNTFYFSGMIDEVAIFTDALEEPEILSVMSGVGSKEFASKPNPMNEAVDVPRDAGLNWKSGEFAVTHDVYVGDSFTEVESATVPTAAGLDVNSLDLGSQSFGETVFWRVMK